MSKLPIHNVLPDLLTALSTNPQCILQAPPGAGKTTAVPIALLDVDWLQGRKILMLEPRRLAARSSAARMADLLGEQLGQSVGYQVKGDRCTSAQTKILVVTEGILTRKLQSDPELDDIAIVIFDEFHERSLHADLSLAFCLQSQSALREDLKLLIMSATLNTQAISTLLGGAPIVQSQGRSFPVENIFWPAQKPKPEIYNISTLIAHLLQQVLQEEDGNILAFLPGVGEIKKLATELRKQGHQDLIIAPLYGNLSKQQQDQAIAAPPEGQRKVVIATNIAETSITIDGITVVIDSGLMRESQFTPNSGMNQLVTRLVSKDSAEQRSGRAGRLSPGKCYRLWSESQHQQLQQHHSPEILNSDLAPLLLEAANWGAQSIEEFDWLDSPPPGAVEQARDLLIRLGAITTPLKITRHGQDMLALGTHPRLGHMLLSSIELGCVEQACLLATLLSEKDILNKSGQRRADISYRLEVLKKSLQGGHINLSACRLVKQQAKLLQQRVHKTSHTTAAKKNGDMTGVLLAHAYPERIAQLRNKKERRYLLSGGKGAAFQYDDDLCNAEYLVIGDLDGKQREATIYSAAVIDEEQLFEYFPEWIETREEVQWDNKTQRVSAQEKTQLGALTLSSKTIKNISLPLVHQALLQGIRERGLECLPWNKDSIALRTRIEFANRLRSNPEANTDSLNKLLANMEIPDLSNTYLLATLEDWLLPHLNKENSMDKLKQLPLLSIIKNMLDWQQQQRLDELLPTHFDVPSGSRIAIDYEPDIPVLAARLQEMFGLQKTPSILKGQYNLLIHLLSPASRPMQITQDLVSFWNNTYQEVKKEQKIKYKRHYWPDDPLQAQATSKTKKNMHRG